MNYKLFEIILFDNSEASRLEFVPLSLLHFLTITRTVKILQFYEEFARHLSPIPFHFPMGNFFQEAEL